MHARFELIVSKFYFLKYFVFLKLEQSTKIWFRVKIWFFVLNALIYRVFYCIIACIILFFIWKGGRGSPENLYKEKNYRKSITSQNFQNSNPLERNQSTIHAKYTSKAYIGYTSLILIRLGWNTPLVSLKLVGICMYILCFS